MGPRFSGFLISAMLFLTQLLSLIDGRDIGVCYGLNGNNLPSPGDVINLYKTSGINNIRLYQPYPEVLEAARGSGISLSMGPTNEDIQSLATDQSAADAWVNTNIVPYKDDVQFRFITIGNEAIPGQSSSYIPDAMNNIMNSLASFGLGTTKVTTVVPMNALSTSYPPSDGAFGSDITSIMTSIMAILALQDSPLLINVYPYFAYASDPTHISLDYALFTSTAPVVVDQGLEYYNLFDGMVDAFNAALDKIGFGQITLIVAETGWPTAGNEPYTSVANAQTYNKNLLNHVTQKGTPKRPEYIMPTFFFEMFNEDLKQPTVEQNFGFFFPNMNPVYPFW
ncbi:Glucan endo-1,3-beta-glucosidase [Gossypium australe]|uniref:glucan endo-1,3-beta-D-glucosidase n=1 Tax=Gossypium australe TaxID=47621 RepID=A0A5B6UCE4_9ROSI|nr:Glucan endo-1,3-beta-glucosidase [Gossypium australe]